MVQEGYAKVTNALLFSLTTPRLSSPCAQYPVFKVALPDRWLVIVSGVKMNEGLQRIPDEQASFDAAGEEVPRPTRAPVIIQFSDT